MKKPLRKILNQIEVDWAVFWGLLAKAWSALAGIITVLLIATKFSSELQGYYYTFNNLLALQIFVELGLGIVIVQFASHEWSHLYLDSQGDVMGNPEALSRLSSLARITLIWYILGSLLVIFGLSIGGYMFFARSPYLKINWMGPWFLLCLVTGVSISLTPIWSLLEGCNQVRRLYLFRFIQGIFISLSLWIAILFKAQLWTLAIANIISLICAGIFLKMRYWNFIAGLLTRRPPGSGINWRAEIFPMQWRIAISWVSGYFVFSFFTPVLFKYQGPVVAGQMGMTWFFIGLLGLVASAWLAPKVPRFGMLIAQKDYQELDRLFWRVTAVISSFTVILALLMWLGVYIINALQLPLAERFLPVLPTGIFLAAQALVTISLPFSSYLRAHKREPLVFLSVLGGISVAVSTLFLGRYYSATGMAVGYLIVNLFIIPLVIIVWRHCKVTWHR